MHKKNTTRSYIFFKGKVNRQAVLHDKFKNNSSRSCRPRLPFHKSTELLLNRIFLLTSVSTGSFLRGFHTQSACHLKQLILKYLNLFYQYHLPRTFSLFTADVYLFELICCTAFRLWERCQETGKTARGGVGGESKGMVFLLSPSPLLLLIFCPAL